MKGKVLLGILSAALVVVVLVFCFSYDGGDDLMTEGTLVSSGYCV